MQENGDNKVLHMVTKESSRIPPKWKDFKRTVVNLKKTCEEKDIKKVILPQIGTGLDGLDWGKVMKVLQATFMHSNVELEVNILSDDEENSYRKTLKNKRLKIIKKETTPSLELLGDSKVRNMGVILNTMSKQAKLKAKTCVTTIPGATTSQMCQRLNAQTSHLLPHDHLYIMSGSNHIILSNENKPISDYEESLLNIFTHSKHVKVSLLSTPLRYDNEEYNQLIMEYNTNKKDLCDLHDIPFLDVNQQLEKEDYAKDGLHLNSNGKEKVARLIIDNAMLANFI